MNTEDRPPLAKENMTINRQREIRSEALIWAKMAEAKVPDPMTHENYGYKKPFYGK